MATTLRIHLQQLGILSIHFSKSNVNWCLTLWLGAVYPGNKKVPISAWVLGPSCSFNLADCLLNDLCDKTWASIQLRQNFYQQLLLFTRL